MLAEGGPRARAGCDGSGGSGGGSIAAGAFYPDLSAGCGMAGHVPLAGGGVVHVPPLSPPPAPLPPLLPPPQAPRRRMAAGHQRRPRRCSVRRLHLCRRRRRRTLLLLSAGYADAQLAARVSVAPLTMCVPAMPSLHDRGRLLRGTKTPRHGTASDAPLRDDARETPFLHRKNKKDFYDRTQDTWRHPRLPFFGFPPTAAPRRDRCLSHCLYHGRPPCNQRHAPDPPPPP